MIADNWRAEQIEAIPIKEEVNSHVKRESVFRESSY